MLSSVYTWEGCKISTSLGMGSIVDREQEQERQGSHDLGSRRMAIFSFVCLIFFLCLAVLLLFCVFVSLFGTCWSQASLTTVGNLPASAS